MILLDTNVMIYAAEPTCRFFSWSCETIAEAVSADGAAINAITLAEVCVGEIEPDTVADRIRSGGVGILDVPAATPLFARHLIVSISGVERRRPKEALVGCRCLISSAVPTPRLWAGPSRLRMEDGSAPISRKSFC